MTKDWRLKIENTKVILKNMALILKKPGGFLMIILLLLLMIAFTQIKNREKLLLASRQKVAYCMLFL